jgi:CheY-like chemotaxis protein
MDDQLLADRRVLIVEDEMLVLMAIEDMLDDLGCTSVAAAANIERALALIEAEPFDIAILDVNLDGKRSYPVAQALNNRGVPFAFSTGYGGHGVDQGYGNRSVLSKPYDNAQLVKVLKALLEPAESSSSAAG